MFCSSTSYPPPHTSDYSGRNPVPTIQEYEARQKAQSSDVNYAEVSAASLSPSTNDQQPSSQQNSPAPQTSEHNTSQTHSESSKAQSNDKEEIMKRMSRPKTNPAKALKIHGERTVRDPVTGEEVVISDAKLDPDEGGSP